MATFHHVTPAHRIVIRVDNDLIWEQSSKSKKHYLYRRSTGEKLLVSRYSEDIEAFLRLGQKHSTPQHRTLIRQSNGIVLEQSTKSGKYYLYEVQTGRKLAVTSSRSQADGLFANFASQFSDDFEDSGAFEEEEYIPEPKVNEQNFYQVLGLNSAQSLTPDILKAAYRKKVAEYHPDRVHGLGLELQQLAEQKTKEINEAYESLKVIHRF
ncbi:DnaJ domain-containing protein [Geitlerinema splendidum]|nr:DnaJ domain-containing protein [Geitlerinema splendidum]